MEPIIIALIGAGSRSFGPETVRDVLLSEVLTQRHINLRLMDIVTDKLSEIGRYAKSLAEKLGRNSEISTTASLEAALDGAQFVVTAVEIERIGHRTTTSRANMVSVRFSPRTAGQGRSSMPCAP
jgi:alpha-galactosidase